METLNDLKKIAKEQNLKNYQNLTKQALAQRLGIPIFFSKKYYQNIAKERKIKNYQNLKKADLVKLLNINPEIPQKPIPAPRMKKKRFFQKTYSSPANEKKCFSGKTYSSSESYLKY